MKHYCLNVSNQGCDLINLIAQTYTNYIADALENIKENETLDIIDSRKSTERKLFIAKLVKNNSEIDQALGEKVAKELIEYVKKNSMNFVNMKFKESMNDHKD